MDDFLNSGITEMSYDQLIKESTRAANIEKVAKREMVYSEAIELVRSAIRDTESVSYEKSDVNASTDFKEQRRQYKAMLERQASIVQTILGSEKINVILEKDDGTSESISREAAAKKMASDMVGFGVLEDAMDDDSISDIYCNAYDSIYAEKSGKDVKLDIKFSSPQEYYNMIGRFLMECGKTLDKGEHKQADLSLYGYRGHAISEVISSNGQRTLTIRKHGSGATTYDIIRNCDEIDDTLGELFEMVIQGGSSFIIAGITGCGKTTLLRCLVNYALNSGNPDIDNRRVLVLEDTTELNLDVRNLVALHTFKGNSENDGVSTNLRDLIIGAMREKPKYICVGEVRGAEAEAAVEAAETGHPVLLTIHAGNVWDVINRFSTKYLMQMPSLTMNVVERIIGNAFDLIVMVDDIPGIGRKVTSIHQLRFNRQMMSIEPSLMVEYDIKNARWVWHEVLAPDTINTLSRRGVKIARIEEFNEKIQREIEKTKQ